MRSRSIVARVVAGTVLVAAVSSIVLAATGAGVATILWRANETRALEQTTAALVRAIEIEAADDRVTLDAAAADALDESAVVGYHIEVWRGADLLAQRAMGRTLGPLSASELGSFRRAGWLGYARPFGKGLVLIVAVPEGQSLRALRVFAWSLLASAPFSLLMAIVVGWLVGRRATRPLLEFTEKVSQLRGLATLEASTRTDSPAEVRELEGSFLALLARLRENLAREQEFASNASHELRTPLTRIRLHAERALADTGAAGRGEITGQIREIDRLVQLVDALLVLARDSEVRIAGGEIVNLADLTRSVTKRVFASGAQPEANLPDEALVRGDGDLLGIAVENLLDNARKFTLDGAESLIELAEEGGVVRLSVTSRGVRIPEGERERLFDRFYRSPGSRDAHKGYGLGLSLARHIARIHGGALECISGSTEDARFCLELPAWGAGPPGRHD